jgi:hypothetical protein
MFITIYQFITILDSMFITIYIPVHHNTRYQFITILDMFSNS